MDDLLARLIIWILKSVLRLLLAIARVVFRLPSPPAREAAIPTAKRVRAPATKAISGRRAPALERAAVDQAGAELRALATRAGALEARCAAAPLGAPLLPTLRRHVLPRLEAATGDLRRASTPQELARVRSTRAALDALVTFFERMADQRRDDAYAELIDDADALADACYAPVLAYCRANAVPLSSDRAATVFGDDCSPALRRLDDPTGLAILCLPWSWLSELPRWTAIGHEVGHDFYESVPGLDAEVLRRHDLVDAAKDPRVLDGRAGVSQDDVDRLVARWRRELLADAFGVMMLGPAYVEATLAIFARPERPLEALAVDVDDSGATYEVHPPGHVRAVAACRLLARMGYGQVGVALEERWRARHGEPAGILLPVPEGWLRVTDEPFLERAVALTASLYQEGFAALRGIPLASMPGFDFGPREHEAALRARDALLSGARPPVTDARLLIAGAVLASLERPQDGVRLLAAARRAVGSLPLRVPGVEGAAAASSRAELVRDAFLLDVLLAPPVALRARRGGARVA